MKKYVVVKSEIDDSYRVMLREDAPYGTCYSVANTKTGAIIRACDFLDITPDEVEEWI